MSLALCRKCRGTIDTDGDPDSTYFDKGFVCEWCREKMSEDELEEFERNLNE